MRTYAIQSENSLKKRVYVGLSGGVDSAVSAALLKDAGYDVVGVFIKGWYPEGLPCTWAKDRRDAMRVAAHLQIPFHTLDASVEYKKSVIDYLVREYGAGRTPNPDIFCNKEVKFGAFYRFAKARGGDFIATGHYARVENGRLYRGKDAAKDQSYFLWAVPQEALVRTMFPLGELEKSKTRSLARHFGLPVAEKKDSQGICFLGPVSMEDFLRDTFHPVSGIAYDEERNVIGEHDGAILVTLGERVALKSKRPGPWYVVKKDLEKNELTVSAKRTAEDASAGVAFTNEHWFSGAPPQGEVVAQYRYHGPHVAGSVAGSRFVPEVPLPESASPGQSIVFYAGDECVGGGIIA
jgi:tRNA-uridine 2-sulfurtransferase